jgi:hypothetical protein
MVAEIRSRAQRRDRWVSWIVIGVVVVALFLGWLVKVAAEGRTVAYNAGGLQVRYPAGWVRVNVEAPILLRVENRLATPFRTTLMLQQLPMPQGGKPLAAVQQSLALERGRAWIAYRVLRVEEPATVEGHTGMRVAFAYVEANPNPFLETVPVVMHGEDFLLPAGDKVYVATLTAAEENFAQAQRYLRSLVRSLPR